MKKTKLKFLSVFAVGIFWVSALQAQESVNASGGDATGAGGSAAYSVGQVVYTSNSSSDGTVSQGVQQTYQISDLGIKETALSISLIAFPNPTTDNLTLQVTDYNNEKLSYQLHDMQGKLLNKGHINSEKTPIDMSSLPTSTYFVNVVDTENQQIKSFKIIKK